MANVEISRILKTRLIDLLNQEYLLGDKFFEELEKIYNSVEDQSDKEVFYSNFLEIVSHLEFPEEIAKEHWDKIKERYKELSKKLGRTISVRTAIIDYFTYNTNVLRNPVVIEIFLYDSSSLKVYVDDMTGLYNYRYFKEALWAESKRAERYNLFFSVAIADIDDLKSINAKHGEDVGSMVIKTFAKIVDLNKRAEDVVCRYGGDEFVMLLPETSKAGAIAFLSRVKRKFEDAIKEKGISVTVSAGTSEFPSDTKDPVTLVDLADKALYVAKLRGKDKIIAWNRGIE